MAKTPRPFSAEVRQVPFRMAPKAAVPGARPRRPSRRQRKTTVNATDATLMAVLGMMLRRSWCRAQVHHARKRLTRFQSRRLQPSSRRNCRRSRPMRGTTPEALGLGGGHPGSPGGCSATPANRLPMRASACRCSATLTRRRPTALIDNQTRPGALQRGRPCSPIPNRLRSTCSAPWIRTRTTWRTAITSRAVGRPWPETAPSKT
mmetsp:Transcript_94878/g.267886  ORF Transcript_94878/g.267886 Transcript_94878/m.267886 type:complete len:205 (-) Transcript_94878:1230-1844(-)